MIRRIGPEEYDDLCRRMVAVVKKVTSTDAVIAVVSKGDPRMIDLEGRTGLHFPGDSEGRYVGYYPRTSEEAIAQLEGARRTGAEFLCLPATALWWLDHYQGLAAWLGAHCRIAIHDPDTCVIYDLMRVPTDPSREAASSVEARLGSLLNALLPEGALVYSIGSGTESLSTPGRVVSPVGADNAFGLRRLLEVTPERPTFVLVSENDSTLPREPQLKAVLETRTRPIARRAGLCVLFEVKTANELSRIPQSPQVRRTSSDPESPTGGEAEGNLSRRLERLDLSGKDRAFPESTD